jgi:Phosphoserine phosphatase RsbU, N-terminal domain
MEVSRNLTEQYSAQLASHLAASNESVLLDAHELGRRAVIDGVGVLDLVNVHHDALRALVAAGGVPTGSKYLDTAAEFLAEALSPFEMMLRGYKEANSRLLAANQELREAKVATARSDCTERAARDTALSRSLPDRGSIGSQQRIGGVGFTKEFDDELPAERTAIRNSLQEMTDPTNRSPGDEGFAIHVHRTRLASADRFIVLDDDLVRRHRRDRRLGIERLAFRLLAAADRIGLLQAVGVAQHHAPHVVPRDDAPANDFAFVSIGPSPFVAAPIARGGFFGIERISKRAGSTLRGFGSGLRHAVTFNPGPKSICAARI